jgi:hypothetical protein
MRCARTIVAATAVERVSSGVLQERRFTQKEARADGMATFLLTCFGEGVAKVA